MGADIRFASAHDMVSEHVMDSDITT